MTKTNKTQAAISYRATVLVKKSSIAKKTRKASKIQPQMEQFRTSHNPPAEQRKTIVMGHRGGNFGPDNSMKNFRGSVRHALEGIEFDVSHRNQVGQYLT